jgi:copper homeostasis protein
MKMYLESCCTNIEEVQRACRMGASRIELCERIDLGGVTPSISLTEKVLKSSTIPVNVMVRPRGGNFVYTSEELEEMAAQIKAFKSLSSSGKFVNGFVFGALTPDNQVDIPATRFLVNVATEDSTPQITFHRAFDDVADPRKALEDIIALGCTHLLTSGNCEDAFKGRFNIAKLVEQAAGRITIIAGKGIRKGNLEQIAEDSKAPQLHGTNLF